MLDDDNSNRDQAIFSLIWIDSNSKNTRDTEEKLQTTVDYFKKFQDLQACQQYIEQSSAKGQLLLVVNDQLARKLVPSVHHLQQIISIYVYCTEKKTDEQWSAKYSKIKGVGTNADELIPKITYHQRIRKQTQESFSIHTFSFDERSTIELNGKFAFFQVLIECLLKLKFTNEDKNEFIDLCREKYQGNKTELDILEQLQNEYSAENALRWYTRESFFYRTINSALRSENIHMMFLLRSYIFDIQQQLQKHQFNHAVKVYRSQTMSKNELEKFRQSQGQLISVNSFFSTSQDRLLTIHMLGETNDTVDWERILFEIDADPKMVKTKPFADISQSSYFPNESEILFITGSKFHVEKIFADENYIWIVQMTLCDDNEHGLTDVLKRMKKQIGKGETNLRTLGKILWNMGQPLLAQKYFERFVNKLSQDDPLHIDLYNDLAKLTSQMGALDDSTKWYQKLITFEESYPFASLVRSLDNSVKIPSNDLELYEEIGNGGFGKVYRAKRVTHGVLVAVKQLHSIYLSKEAKQTFLNELLLLSRARHHHIVTFYGACLENERCALVIEYMSLGSLYELLYKKKITISWSRRLSIALQATKGIDYLHQYQPPIWHRDIKSLNLLLETHQEGYLVKVCDFGMAKTRDETTRQTKERSSEVFTLSWAAPEVLQLEPYTGKSNVYSLSIVYWELESCTIPYDGHQNDLIRGFVLAGSRLEIPDSTPLNFCTVIRKCWAQKPED